MADFGVTEDGHPDEVLLPGSHGTTSNETLSSGNSSDPSRTSTNSIPPKPMQPPARPMGRPGTNAPAPKPPHTPNHQAQRPGMPAQGRPNPQMPPKPAVTKPQPPNPPAQQAGTGGTTSTPPPNGGPAEPVAFFSARSVKVPEAAATGAANVPIQGAQLFNPRADSPSIRKTPGIDHQSSRPVAKNLSHVAPLKKDVDQPRAPSPRPGNNGFSNGAAGMGVGRPGMGNPMLNQTRQIGAPGGGGSPLGNRGAYKPPTTVKRPAPGVAEGGNRPPLTEVSNNGTVNNTAVGGGTDAKRQKIT
ncbi:DNA repair protein rad52 [Diatrype stigma]|uniref:DNA repair protein rad52 n=1 Tax=Diatrype stigma TaxID=117547 RepID=A0AAN9YRH7_9PEZI